MNWEHVRLIFCREIRDQLRDRRTLFTIAILPLLLYPVMGMVLLQVTQFHREQHVRIGLIGYENWPASLPLLAGSQLASNVHQTEGANQVHIQCEQVPGEAHGMATEPAKAKQLLVEHKLDLLMVIDGAFADNLNVLSSPTPVSKSHEVESPWRSLVTFYSSKSNDRSLIAEQNMRLALEHWQRSWFAGELAKAELSEKMLQPLEVRSVDLSPPGNRSALLWSKLLPFIMLIWALTGAFYPAIDLCAGEKERGTLETLLSSPALRRDIVWGKLLTVMCFSVGTALLNLLSMQLTSSLVMQQFARLGSTGMMQSLGPLPISSIGWLIMMLLPISALFSALAMAIASLARSSKEGQYYLMPLLFVGMPLVMIPMMPGVELTVGMSIVPVTGAVLLARALLDGHYHEALIHLPFVVAVTASACLLAIRWAVGQFESEQVLFRENEKFNLQNWLRHVWRDRGQTASVPEALLCGTVVLLALFFGRLMATQPAMQWSSIASSVLALQLGLVLAPCLIMATMLTRSIRESLRVHLLHPLDIPVAALMAIGLHPCYVFLSSLIQMEYAIGSETQAVLHQYDVILASAPLGSIIFCLAVLPAICEELTFRGFILGGLLSQNRVWQAILISSIFFGLSHGMLQQSLAASIIGLVLGFVAWRSGGVVCSLAFHIVHNSLSLFLSRQGQLGQPVPHSLNWIVELNEGGWSYTPSWFWVGILLAILGATWFLSRAVPQRFSRRTTLRNLPPSQSMQKQPRPF